jgi:hypothetical protein
MEPSHLSHFRHYQQIIDNGDDYDDDDDDNDTSDGKYLNKGFTRNLTQVYIGPSMFDRD